MVFWGIQYLNNVKKNEKSMKTQLIAEANVWWKFGKNFSYISKELQRN